MELFFCEILKGAVGVTAGLPEMLLFDNQDTTVR